MLGSLLGHISVLFQRLFPTEDLISDELVGGTVAMFRHNPSGGTIGQIKMTT